MCTMFYVLHFILNKSIKKMFHSQGNLDPKNKCMARRMSGRSEVAIIQMSVLYKGGRDSRMYGHGFIYMDFSYLYVTEQLRN